jgi:uncharacterized repeat protein (TIGR01451 family)
VGPQGQSVPLLSDAADGFTVDDLTLRFDDVAADPLPADDWLVSGTWRPIGPLSAFGGTSPNGVWQLFVADDYPSQDGGSVAGGWSLAFSTTNRGCCINTSSVDLVLTQQATADPVALSNTVTYTVTVSNRGPAVATLVTLVDALSPDAVFLSAAASQGSCTHTAGTVRCELGTLPPGAEAVAQIQVIAVGGPQLASAATVSAAEFDPDASNNQAISITAVQVPLLTIADSRVMEGGSGTRQAVFAVSLSEPSVLPVEVDYRTVAGTAVGGVDYLAQSNRLQFLPGEIVQTILVPVSGDTLNEDEEIFQVLLSNPHNAALAVAEATGRILDDDPLPEVSISDATVVEGNSGTTGALFTVSLSAVSGRALSVVCSTSNGTARAGSDYVGISRQIIILVPGQHSTNLTVLVNGDIEIERDETFLVQLSNPTNAVLGRNVAQGTIVSEEFAPVLSVAGYRVVAESQSPANDTVDPGETVTVSVALRNDGSRDTTNLVVTLQAGGGIQSPSEPQFYGGLTAGGPQVSQLFTFTAGVTNCGPLRATLHMQEGAVDLGTIPLVVEVGGGQEFIIQSLSATGSRMVDTGELTGYSRGSIAVSGSQVFVTGDYGTARFTLAGLSGSKLNPPCDYETLISDLRSEIVYVLGDGDTPVKPPSPMWRAKNAATAVTVTSLLELDGGTGTRTGKRIDLSAPITLWSTPGLFAGYGRIVLHSGLRVSNIDVTSGQVTDLGPMSLPPHQPSQWWAFWGVAEFFDGAVHLVYVRDSTTIARTRVPDGATTTLASFRNLGNMSSIAVSPGLGRWYFAYGLHLSQFGDAGVTLGYADAVVTSLCGNSPPVVRCQPENRRAMEGGAATGRKCIGSISRSEIC